MVSHMINHMVSVVSHMVSMSMLRALCIKLA